MRFSDLVLLKHTCSISLSEEKGSITPHSANIPCQASLEEKLNKDISGVSPSTWKVFVRVPLKKSLVLSRDSTVELQHNKPTFLAIFFDST